MSTRPTLQTTAAELTWTGAQMSQTNPDSDLPAGTEDRFLLDTDTASTRALHFQGPLRIERRHATVLQLLRRRVLAIHTETCGSSSPAVQAVAHGGIPATND